MAGSSSSSLGVVGAGQLGGNEVGVVDGELQRVDVAAMIDEAPSAEGLLAGNSFDHVHDTKQ